MHQHRFRAFPFPQGPPLPGQGPFQGQPPEPVSGWIGFELMSAAHEAMRRVHESLTALGITPPQHLILLALNRGGTQSQKVLGETLWIDRTTVVRLLDELEERGAVRRDPNPIDRRAHVVQLTETGELLLADANERLRQTGAEFLSVLSVEEQRQFRELLRRLGGQAALSGESLPPPNPEAPANP